MTTDQLYRINNALAALATEFDVTLTDATLDDLTHIVAGEIGHALNENPDHAPRAANPRT